MDHAIFKFLLTYYIENDLHVVGTSNPIPEKHDVEKCCEKRGVPKACIGLCMEEGSLSSRNLPIGEFGACAKFTFDIVDCKITLIADYDPDDPDDPDYVLPTKSQGNGSIYTSLYSLYCQKSLIGIYQYF